MFEQQDLQMIDLNLNKNEKLEVVGRAIETQLHVGENVNFKM